MDRRPHSERISVCIIAFNEEDNIRRCLRSLTWADEIVVVDSHSTDGTREIARQYTDKVHEHKWLGYIGQKKLIKGLAAGPWIMFVDADEEVSDELRDEIEDWFSRPVPSEIAGFEFPRLVRYLDRWIRHGEWYPDVKLRLFRKDRGECGGTEPHDRVFVEGQVRRLRGRLYHYTYAGIQDQLATLDRFARISAQHRFAAGRRFRLTDVLIHPLYRFVRGYFLKLGFLDGLPGLIIAVNVAFGTFLKYAKLWEMEHTATAAPGESPAAPTAGGGTPLPHRPAAPSS
jgi:glycosyltransferase involved in cell wall biosynthesis